MKKCIPILGLFALFFLMLSGFAQAQAPDTVAVKRTVFLPNNRYFETVMFDPKEWQNSASIVRYRVRKGQGNSRDFTTITPVSIAVEGGLIQWATGKPGENNGIQIGIAAGVFSQFNLESDSWDLLNADYIVGIPVTFRHDGWSGRFRIFHQSSHLGDEFLLNGDISPEQRKNLSFEMVEFLGSRDIGPTRLYAGVAAALHQDKEDNRERFQYHAGIENKFFLKSTKRLLFVVGADVKGEKEYDYFPSTKAGLGIEFRNPEQNTHRLRIAGEYYYGYQPYSQFEDLKVQWYGATLYFDLN
ncbi:DUF1207 domain-containing protein [Rufibacter immobilis]|uniref:DUF1207 domain-containing protein n=1 Tax=Rufibacter immobilis TaxID=1348778 RepID=UPI0035EA0BC5